MQLRAGLAPCVQASPGHDDDQGEALRQGEKRLLLAGFGVGWSWGAATVRCGPMTAPEVIVCEAAAPSLTGSETCGAL